MLNRLLVYWFFQDSYHPLGPAPYIEIDINQTDIALSVPKNSEDVFGICLNGDMQLDGREKTYDEQYGYRHDVGYGIGLFIGLWCIGFFNCRAVEVLAVREKVR
tara:strand:+ start:15275 stop:15586 length:312 start_codon:yes stop_codon:yes gene_type:complete